MQLKLVRIHWVVSEQLPVYLNYSSLLQFYLAFNMPRRSARAKKRQKYQSLHRGDTRDHVHNVDNEVPDDVERGAANNNNDEEVPEQPQSDADIDKLIRLEEETAQRLAKEQERADKLRQLAELREQNQQQELLLRQAAASRSQPATASSQAAGNTTDRPNVNIDDLHSPPAHTSSQAAGNRTSDKSRINIEDLRRMSALRNRADDYTRDHLDRFGFDDDSCSGMQELDDDRGMLPRRRLKSGIDIKVTDRVVYPQRWPHHEVLNESVSSEIKYKDLTLRLLTLGELEIITSDDISDKEKSARLRLLKTLLYHAGNFNWASVLDFFAAVLQKIEMGKADWSDDFGSLEHMILSMRPSSVLQKSVKKGAGKSASASQSGTSNGEERVLYCQKFQKGTCDFSQDHMTPWKGDTNNMVFVHHICAKCLINSGKKLGHASGSSDCPCKKQ